MRQRSEQVDRPAGRPRGRIAAAMLTAVAAVVALGVVEVQAQSVPAGASPPPPPAGPYPVDSDGSVQTPSGYLCKARFAICNNATCRPTKQRSGALTGRASGKGRRGGDVTCRCREMNTWTLSPIPCSTLKALTTSTQLISTFTTMNTARLRGLACNGTRWANCYGARCRKNPRTGAVTCRCPYVVKNPGLWGTFAGGCNQANCSRKIMSGSPLNWSIPSEFAAAMRQIGQRPLVPRTCPAGRASGKCPYAR
jgi:hypothetical protein